MRQIEITSLRERVANEIRASILNGDFKPGDELIQSKIANILGVSRMPVREAIQQLRSEGLVEVIPNRGAYVKPVSVKTIADFFFVRSLLEGEATFLACQNADENDIRIMEELCNKYNLTDIKEDDYRELNEQFHQLLWELSGNTTLETLLHQLWAGSPPIIIKRSAEDMRDSILSHLKILEAIKAKDPERARALMQEHLKAARQSNIASHIKLTSELEHMADS